MLFRLALHLFLQQACLQDFERGLFVPALGALVLAGDNDAGGNVGDADRRGILLDVLAAVAAGAEGVDAQLVRVQAHFGLALDFGHDFGQRERGVARLRGVERRDAHEAVDSALAAQVAVGVAAADFDCRALDAGLFACSHVEDVCLVAALVGPAEVHSQKHLCPVLRVGAACAGVNRQNGVATIVFAGKCQA